MKYAAALSSYSEAHQLFSLLPNRDVSQFLSTLFLNVDIRGPLNICSHMSVFKETATCSSKSFGPCVRTTALGSLGAMLAVAFAYCSVGTLNRGNAASIIYDIMSLDH